MMASMSSVDPSVNDTKCWSKVLEPEEAAGLPEGLRNRGGQLLTDDGEHGHIGLASGDTVRLRT